jgi:hypothetical protein
MPSPSSSRLLVAALGLSALTGCSHEPACAGAADCPPPGSAGGPVTYYRDAKPILDQACVPCHGDAGSIAPYSLATYAGAKAVASTLKKAVVARSMPPWMAAEDCADYLDDRSLDEASIRTLADWVDQGTIEGDPAAPGLPLSPSFGAGLSRVDLTLSMESDYLPKATTAQDLRCFVLDWPESETRHVTGFRAKPGEPRVVHRVTAFRVPPEQVKLVEAMDAADEGPGYACFGGDGIDRAPLLGMWTPGSSGEDYPQGTGIAITPGSKVVLQVHYVLSYAGPLPDRTAIELSLSDEVEERAWFQPWTNESWVSGGGLSIPAYQASSHDFSADPTAALGLDHAIRVYAIGLHMHELGTGGAMAKRRSDGSRECLLELPFWSFYWQRSYWYRTPKEIAPGEAIELSCRWDNGPNNAHGNSAVPVDETWGEGKNDEMCLGYFYMSEK